MNIKGWINTNGLRVITTEGTVYELAATDTLLITVDRVEITTDTSTIIIPAIQIIRIERRAVIN